MILHQTPIKLICLLAALQLHLIGQIAPDSILDGSTLLNLKKAEPNVYYNYKIMDGCFTLIKFKHGKISHYLFNSFSNNSEKIDTTNYSDKTGFSVKLNKKNKNPSNIIRISNSKSSLYLDIIAKDSTTTKNIGNEYFYYSNKRLSGITKRSKGQDTSVTLRYTKKGKLSDVITENNLNNYKEIILFSKKGDVSAKIKKKNDITVTEKYFGGNIIQVDSMDAEYKLIGTRIVYYPNQKIKIKTGFLDGQQNGICYSYYDDGKLKAFETYVLGKRLGRYIYYNKDGTIDKEGVYR